MGDKARMKSVLTKYEDISVFSGRPKQSDHHLIFGAHRKAAEKFGLKIPLTNDEHNLSSNGTINQIHGNPAAERLSEISGQLAFEKEYYRKMVCGKSDADPAREEFRKIFGKSYL